MKDFTTFTGFDMLKIDIANSYGLDKLTFSERMAWTSKYKVPTLLRKVSEASEPLLYKKAVLAYQTALAGLPIGHNVFMDATASGLQILACLSNCQSTGIHTNLVFNGKRNDPYTIVAEEMTRLLPLSPMIAGKTPSEVRALIKKPIMTTFYSSKAQPKSLFGEDTIELETFYDVLNDLFAGPMACMAIIESKWNPTALYHQWTLPDGHVSHVKVIEQVDTKIEVAELSCANTFAYRFYPNQASKRGTSLVANIVHSIDAYIVREIIRRCPFDVAHIHDAFTCHPNNMPVVMATYRTILSEIASSSLLADILSEITSTDVVLQKYDYDLSTAISTSQYALS
jgi:hypothetical protein